MFINASEFQRLIYPAYCITTHKMLGETIKKPYTIHEFNRMDQKLKYVALTRASRKITFKKKEPTQRLIIC